MVACARPNTHAHFHPRPCPCPCPSLHRHLHVLHSTHVSHSKSMAVCAFMNDSSAQVKALLARQDSLGAWYIIRPGGARKSVWDVTILALVFISAFSVPLELAYRDLLVTRYPRGTNVFNGLEWGKLYLPHAHCAYGIQLACCRLGQAMCVGMGIYFLGGGGVVYSRIARTLPPPPRPIFAWLHVVVAPAFIAFFSIDLFQSFFVAYRDMEGVWVVDLRRIAWHYVSSPQLFPVDLLAIVPFQEASEASGALALFKVLRLLRLGKVLRLKESLLTSRLGVSFRMSRMFIFIVLLMHWTACAWRVASIETASRHQRSSANVTGVTWVDPIAVYIDQSEIDVELGIYDPWKVREATQTSIAPWPPILRIRTCTRLVPSGFL